ncbi:P-loop containing nucleoside triphosphate hydrolase protein [Lipomyces arxii]|uniref:P-loop containing nucleoside triphosphate hydrolase protein n=1 Tax=Lipomyces arxii TaxID=56418 RepID=UPI0034CF6CE3
MAKPGRSNSSLSAEDEKRSSTSHSGTVNENLNQEKEESIKLPAQKAGDEDLYAHLPEHEAKILRAQVETPDVNVNLFSLFKYATKTDRLLLVIAYFCAAVGGAVLPVITIVLGQFALAFTNYFVYGGSQERFQHEVNKNALYLVYLGIGSLGAIAISTSISVDRGEIVSSRIRALYLRAILRQNIGYFDNIGTGEITKQITADMNQLQNGMSDKITLVVSAMASFFGAFVVGFIKSWALTLICGSGILAMLFTVTGMVRLIVSAAKNSMIGIAKGSSIVDEVFSSVRNVQAFGIQDRLAQGYDVLLADSEKWGARDNLFFGSMFGILWFYIYCILALGYWQGSRFIVSGDLQVNAVITVTIAMMMGSFAFGQVGPNARAIGAAVAASSKVYAAIERQSVIDSFSKDGVVLENVHGDIELKDVKFIYPSRPDVTILENFSLKVSAGQTVALVGASGSGKSTIIGILERFYQPVSGSVTIDGHEIDEVNISWLRQQIALVSQEPTLFSCSVYENVAYGLIGTKYENVSEDEKRKLVTVACEQSNAMSFINDLPDGLDTNVGERGFLMSGGQKQRIAIARAIVSNPKILLLDEATSALDTKSEGIVQDALDKASKSRTTIVIAHRLSTIRDADLIVVMNRGKIVEQGTHNELLDLNGLYAELIEAQQITKLEVVNSATGEEVSAVEVEQKLVIQEDSNMLGLARTQSIKEIPHVEESAKYYTIWSSLTFMYKLNRPELLLLLTGFFGSFISGLGFPLMAIFTAKCITSFQVTPDEYDKMRHTINMYSGFFFMMAIVECAASVIGMGILGLSAQKLVHRIRYLSFKHLLRQDIAFFDRDENSSGAITAMLATDAQMIEGLAGASIGQVFTSITTVIVGIILGISVSWKFGLVCTACMPLLLAVGYARIKFMTYFGERTQKSFDKSAAYAAEAIGSVRTVISLTREQKIFADYEDMIKRQISADRNSTYGSSILYAATMSLTFFVSALSFWYGGSLIGKREIGTIEFYIPTMAIIQGAQSAGIAFGLSSDITKARRAAQDIQKLFDTIPTIDVTSDEGIIPETTEGTIEFENVHFRYPTRMEVPVLRGLNLTVHKGEYIALVGSSGCGKSTAIGLIESFYRPHTGRILFDGIDISEINVAAYRSKIALVQQEPVLYSGSIKYNICLGAERDVSTEEIYDAARQANIHDFIMSLPDGYDTLCGSKGVLLSGGQKQRVAIARALIRQPAVLLLDEATSALDSESEKVVQEALDRAAKGRTTIAIAHRLSTIQKADKIYVLENGKVLESGTHQELLANRSKYYELVQLQALEKT